MRVPETDRYWDLWNDLKWPAEAADHAWAWKTKYLLHQARVMPRTEWPADPPLIRCQRPGPQPDVLSESTDLYVVSGCLRAFLDAEAPGACQFLAVRLEGPGGKAPPGEYWVVNWLRAIECMHESSYGDEVDESGKRKVWYPVIDPSIVPPDAVLGIVEGFRGMRLIRGDLRKKIKDAGFTGVRFGKLGHAEPSSNRPSEGTARARRPRVASTKLPPRKPLSGEA
jgi:hypothetical protein